MRNLNYYSHGCFDAYELAVSQKRDFGLQARLATIRTNVELEYTLYRQNFFNGTLEKIKINPLLSKHSVDLLSLYVYRSKTIKDIKSAIEALQESSIRYTCQYCGLDATGTLDHYLPKEEFPVFSVNPINLVPCCSNCNSYKSKQWLINGDRIFINPYLDILPVQQYLFCDVFEDKNKDFNFKFYLKESDGLNPDFVSRLHRHFERLHLFDRMRKASIAHVSEFLHLIRRSVLMNGLSLQQVKDTQFATVSDNRAAYGTNYWKAALELALIQSPEFLRRV